MIQKTSVRFLKSIFKKIYIKISNFTLRSSRKTIQLNELKNHQQFFVCINQTSNRRGFWLSLRNVANWCFIFNSLLFSRFDVLVNGGGAVTLQFQRSPFRPLTRTVFVPWNRIVVLPPVQMQLSDDDETARTAIKWVDCSTLYRSFLLHKNNDVHFNLKQNRTTESRTNIFEFNFIPFLWWEHGTKSNMLRPRSWTIETTID